MTRARRKRRHDTAPPPPTIPELEHAPELASVVLLEHALSVAADALLAEHMILIDDFRAPGEHGPAVALADVICRRAARLRDLLRRYRRVVRDAAPPAPDDAFDDRDF